ncbi:MAG TPA: hypothetical protein VMW81_01140 [Nitrospinota bacterium]|nr:hypothetical protein [Nitrospinota bacterium]
MSEGEAKFFASPSEQRQNPVKKSRRGVLLFVLFLDEQEKDITVQKNTVKKISGVSFFVAFAF